jgi:hypothetical protein
LSHRHQHLQNQKHGGKRRVPWPSRETWGMFCVIRTPPKINYCCIIQQLLSSTPWTLHLKIS